MYLEEPGFGGLTGLTFTNGSNGYQYSANVGEAIILGGNQGGNNANFTNTVFADAGAGLLSGGVAPFTGTYKPVNAFTTLTQVVAGGNPNGTWTYVVLDHVNSGYTGVFLNATLTITYGNGTYSWTSNPAGF